MQEDVYQEDGLNLYAYCGNNPVMYYDPSGFSALKKSKKEINKYIDPSNLPDLTATQKKHTPGRVTGTLDNYENGNKIRSSDSTTIAIPKSVA